MKIAVIAGGLSPERDVSLSSGSMIANALIERGHKVCLIDLYFGEKLLNAENIFKGAESTKFEYLIPDREPDLKMIEKESKNEGMLIGENVIELCKMADLAFLALHGGIGENGRIQAVLDCYNITYTGTGYTGSMLAMDKSLTKVIMKENEVLTPPCELIDTHVSTCFDISKIGYPCVIKPLGGGSSIGISIAENPEGLDQAISYAKKYEDNIIIEKYISGREFSVGILDGKALPVIEIIPAQGFFDYKNKYQPGLTAEICPAEISEDLAEKIKKIASRVHSILRLGSYSRIDFIMDETGDIYCLEANTLPGMTPNSLLPQEAAAAGISYGELCERIAMLAVSGRYI